MYTKIAYGLAFAAAVGMTDAAEILSKRDGAGGHHHEPASGYGAPSSGYDAPASGYGAPASGYDAPASGYGAPAAGYDAPASGYDAPTAPSYGGDGDVGFKGFNPLFFLLPILILVGLSLLFPTITTVSTRKRRNAVESNPVYDLAERVNDIYGAVLQSEECMEKIACELGVMAKDITASPVAGMITPFVPQKYAHYYKQFTAGANCDKIKCGK